MTLKDALEEVGISYDHWQTLRIKHGIPSAKRRKATMYTPERVREVKRRIRGGEFAKDIAEDMGMNAESLFRYCRHHGIKLFSKASLAKNYKRRVGRGAPRGRKPGSSKIVPKVRVLLAEGLSDSAIAKKLGISRAYANMIRHNKHMKPKAKPSP